MRYRYRERVGGIRLQRAFQAKQYAHHVLHLSFIAPAATYHGLFYFCRSILVHCNALADYRTNRGASRLPQLQSRIGVTCHEHTLDTTLIWPMRRDDGT